MLNLPASSPGTADNSCTHRIVYPGKDPTWGRHIEVRRDNGELLIGRSERLLSDTQVPTTMQKAFYNKHITVCAQATRNYQYYGQL